MPEAFAWGLISGSSLILGGIIALRVRIPMLALGLIMAFGSGVLISAVAYELVQEEIRASVTGLVIAVGLLLGACVFFAGDSYIDHLGGRHRKRSSGVQAEGSPLALVLGIVMDGIPESIVLGLSLLTGGAIGLALLAAVFLSNVPESIAATIGLVNGGWPRKQVMGLWVLVALVSAVAALAGYVLLEGASPRTIAFVNAFAAGAILTMLADTMMPEAFEHGGRLVGLATTLGFVTAFSLTALE